MAVCPHCRQETDGTLPFCQFCGQRLAVENEPTATGLPSWLTRASQGPTPSQQEAAQSIKPQLVVRLTAVAPSVANQSAGHEFPLDGREVRIGRAPSCEINLDGDPLVSRFHAVLRSNDGVYSVTDLGSSNGTLVNDQEVHSETTLREGDELTIGECRMSIVNSYFEIDTAHVPQPVAQQAEAAPIAPQFGGFGGEYESPSSNGHGAFNDPFAAPTGPIGEFSVAEAPAPEEPAAPPPPKVPEPEELRDQMASVSSQLTQQAREAILVADHYRNALEDARQRVTGALSQQPPADSVVYKGDLNGLSDLVRQVVENPQHLELVTRLASRATEVATALDTLNATAPYANLLGALADLRKRLEEALAR